MRDTGRRSRRKSRNAVVTVLAVICILLAAGLMTAFAMVGQGKKEADGLRESISELESRLEEAEEAAEKATADSEKTEEDRKEEQKEEEKEDAGTAGKEDGADMKESAPSEDGGSLQEDGEEEGPGVSSPYLDSLSGIAPGTVLSEEQLDFSDLDRYFMSWEIEEGDNLYERINGKSYRKNDYVPLSSLRYLKLPHYNFDGRIQVGELVVSKDIEEDVFAVFKELFQAKYQIQSMYLVDNYWTGNPDTTDSASIDENNTSAFCYRQVTGGKKLSNHAYGKAIDLNPQQNPYVSYGSGAPKWSHSNANDYIKRDTGLAHVITHEDLAYKVFTKYGFRWGGDWTNPKDYQHFDKN